MPAITIGDYWAEGGVITDYPEIYVDDKTKEKYNPIPSVEEISAALGWQVLGVGTTETFRECYSLIAAPKLPNQAVMDYEGSTHGLFCNCPLLKLPPGLPKQIGGDGSLAYAFYKCLELIQAPVIPATAKRVDYMFYQDDELLTPVSIPQSVERMTRIYSGCEAVSGEFIVRPTTLTTYTSALSNTLGSLTLYGDKSICEEIAATANNGNAHWSAWYDPTPAVTDRGQGSYTTADDLTRMVRNGALAVSSYAPGRMVYHQGDIVRADEWEALVEAAQTIDPTVTLSTHYTNLNKIEKAFDDAL